MFHTTGSWDAASSTKEERATTRNELVLSLHDMDPSFKWELCLAPEQAGPRMVHNRECRLPQAEAGWEILEP